MTDLATQIFSLRNELDRVTRERDEAKATAARVKSQLTAAEQQVQYLSGYRDNLTRERDLLLAERREPVVALRGEGVIQIVATCGKCHCVTRDAVLGDYHCPTCAKAGGS